MDILERLHAVADEGADPAVIDEAMAEIVRLRRFLLTIRDAGMTADDAAEHAAFALMPEGARHRAWE